jgi:hypothetical protein
MKLGNYFRLGFIYCKIIIFSKEYLNYVFYKIIFYMGKNFKKVHRMMQILTIKIKKEERKSIDAYFKKILLLI